VWTFRLSKTAVYQRLQAPILARQGFYITHPQTGLLFSDRRDSAQKGKDYMNNEKTNDTAATTTAEAPALVKRIGKTTYRVKVHFSTTSRETMSDKIKRMLRDEVKNM
jgi:hypothetical protein